MPFSYMSRSVDACHAVEKSDNSQAEVKEIGCCAVLPQMETRLFPSGFFSPDWAYAIGLDRNIKDLRLIAYMSKT